MNKCILLLFIVLFGACQEINTIKKTQNLYNNENQTPYISRNIKFIQADLKNLFESDQSWFLRPFYWMVKGGIFSSSDKEISRVYKELQETLTQENNQMIRNISSIEKLEELKKMIVEELDRNSSNSVWNYTEFEGFIFFCLKTLGSYFSKYTDGITDPLAKLLQKEGSTKKEDLDFLAQERKEHGILITEEIEAIKNFLFNYNEKSKENLENKLREREKLVENNISMQTCTRDAMRALLKESQNFLTLVSNENPSYSSEDLAFYLRLRTKDFKKIFEYLNELFNQAASIKFKDRRDIEKTLSEINNLKIKLKEEYQNQLILSKEDDQSMQSKDFFIQQINLYRDFLEKYQKEDILDTITSLEDRENRGTINLEFLTPNPEGQAKIDSLINYKKNQIYIDWYSKQEEDIKKIEDANNQKEKLLKLEVFKKELKALLEKKEPEENILSKMKEFEEKLELSSRKSSNYFWPF